MSDSSQAIVCARCGNTAPPAEGVTYGGGLGTDIRTKSCQDCWQAWLDAEVMVINELRLNFMDPESLPTLTKHLREFLALDSPGEPT